MGLLERIDGHLRGERAWPVGQAVVNPGDQIFGHHDERFSPPEYENYIATSADVYSAVTLRARLMSGLDLLLYSARGTSKEQIERGPVFDLLRHVNPFWTLRRLIRMDEMSMGIWGESFWAIERDRHGVPSEIWWLKAPRVRPVVHEQGYLSGFLYEPVAGGASPIRFAPDEVVWFRYPNPVDEFSPLSPLAAARLAADTGASMMKTNQKLFEQGLMPGGVVVPASDQVTFSAEQAKELERDLARRFKGGENAHRWGVLRFEAQLKGLNVTPDDAQFIEGMNLTLRQVANAYGIPTPLLNDMEHATLANLRELDQAVWSHALKPDADLRAEEIEEQLLPMFGRQRGFRSVTHVAWNYDEVPALQAAKSDIWGRDRQAIEAGAMTINEWRAKQGMAPVDWGDVWWAPANKYAVTDEESTPPAASTQTPQEPAQEPEGDGDNGGEAVDEGAARSLLSVLPRINGHAFREFQ